MMSLIGNEEPDCKVGETFIKLHIFLSDNVYETLSTNVYVDHIIVYVQ